MIVLTRRWTQLRYHDRQAAAWSTQSRFVGLPCGRGSGKTELAKRRLVRYLPVDRSSVHSEAPRYFYAGPTYQQAMRTAWEDLKALIPPEWEPKTKDNCIRTVFGSELWVFGLDNPQRIEGVQYDGGVIDESCDQWPGSFDLTVVPALTWRHGWCWRIGVPKRQGVGASEFKNWCKRVERGEIENASVYTWPSSDIVPPEALAWAQKNMDPKDYREQFDAQWETAGGAIFYSFSLESNVRPCPYRPDSTIVIGSDFNVDPMCWVLGHVVKNSLGVECVEWFDEIVLRDANTVKTLDVLWNRYGNHRAGFEFYGDATGKARKTSASQSDYVHIANDARFKDAGRRVWYPQSNPPVAERFSACNAMLCNAAGQRRMHVDPRCRMLVKDLSDRHYKPGTMDVNDFGDLGHITDAAGYFVWARFPVKVHREPVKSPVIVMAGS